MKRLSKSLEELTETVYNTEEWIENQQRVQDNMEDLFYTAGENGACMYEEAYKLVSALSYIHGLLDVIDCVVEGKPHAKLSEYIATQLKRVSDIFTNTMEYEFADLEEECLEMINAIANDTADILMIRDLLLNSDELEHDQRFTLETLMQMER